MIVGLISCTTNPDGSQTFGQKGSIFWLQGAPKKYVIEYLNEISTWRICEMWEETYTPNSEFADPVRLRGRYADSLESRGVDPMICHQSRRIN